MEEKTILYDLYKSLKEDMDELKIDNQKLKEEIKVLNTYIDTRFNSEKNHFFSMQENLMLRISDKMEQKYHLMRRN